MKELIDFITVAGVFAFSISGALTAMERRFDIFGVLIIAFATAVGGGSLRDVMIGSRTVFWLLEPVYIYVAIGGAVFSMFFRNKLCHVKKALSLFDTIGLALYTIIGVKIGIENELPGLSCIALGTITGAFGGVIRDILVNDVPLIFKKEIYATISIFGGSFYYISYVNGLQNFWIEFLAICSIIILRSVVVFFKISFPSIYKKEI